MEIKKKWQEFLEKHMNMRLAAVILIIGILFLCLPHGSGKNETEAKISTEFSHEKYVSGLEKRLSSILSTVSGVSDVSVMITVSDSGVNTHEKNKSTKSGENSSELSLKSQGSGKDEPILVKKSLPTVLGVVVTAKGAENPQKNAEIMSAVKAVLDVSAHRISVLSK